jgi:hypothetical protein
VRVLSPQLENVLGYSPRVDVLLEKEDGSRRLWIEFEISRADPVANHAKFATAHLFQPQPQTDVFLSMVSSHVARGRRNLAANTVWLMRYAGMKAYQTHLLPYIAPDAVKRLNYLGLTALAQKKVDVIAEIRRALAVSQVLAEVGDTAVHFAANATEVALNLHQWNEELLARAGQQLWGRRTVAYFVYDPHFGRFAPSKFCAYVPVPATMTAVPISGITMTADRYVQIDHDEPIFDGRRAHHTWQTTWLCGW